MVLITVSKNYKMKKNKYSLFVFSMLFFCFSFISSETKAQTENEKVVALIFHMDSAFWNAYNNCDITNFKKYITDDVEFYHDKGGITIGADDLAASIKNNLCSNPDYHLRREAVAGTVKAFPLQKANVIYGAIITGEHYFYLTQKDKIERRDGWAKFTQLWILKDGVWKMNRILSYDHAPAPYLNARREIKLSAKELNQFVGKYTGPSTGVIGIEKENNTLVLVDKTKRSILYAGSANVFFMKEKDLTFEFVKDGNNVSSMKVRENGVVAEELKKN